MSAQPGEKQRSAGKRALIVVLVIVLLLGGLVGAGAYLWSQFGDQISHALGWSSDDYEGEGEGQTTIVISAGETGEDVARTLAQAGVVKTFDAFYKLLLAQESQVDFQPGSYRLKLQMSSQAALTALQDPANKLAFTAMIPEGKTVAQTIELIAAGADIPLSELQAAVADPSVYGLPAGVDSLEGWLFPATYEFEETTTGAEAIARLVSEQKAVLDSFGVAEADRERVLTIASIVQREAGRLEDFGKVSRVIQNRLAADMTLGMDSTVQYGYGQHNDGSVWSTDEALADDNPWNTYLHKGLPKGPIANPGRDAIAAAIDPTPGDWLYFTAVNLSTGESVFSDDYAGQQAAEAQLRAWCAADASRGC